MFYEEFKEIFGSGEEPHANLTFFQVFIAGGLTGIFTWGLIYPIDSLKSIAQTEPITVSKRRYSGYFDLVRKHVAKNGIRSLYMGVSICVARAFPVNAVTFTFYEVADNFLDRYGKHYHERESLDFLI